MYLPILPELAVEKWHSPPIYVEQFWVPVRHQKKITAVGVNNNKNWKNPDQEKKIVSQLPWKDLIFCQDILIFYDSLCWINTLYPNDWKFYKNGDYFAAKV